MMNNRKYVVLQATFFYTSNLYNVWTLNIVAFVAYDEMKCEPEPYINAFCSL